MATTSTLKDQLNQDQPDDQPGDRKGATPARRSPFEVALREHHADRFTEALGRWMPFDRFAATMSSLVNQSPQLRQCDPHTLLVASMHIAMARLSPIPVMGEAWVLAFRNGKKSRDAGRDVSDAQFVLGYKGGRRLAMDTGKYRSFGMGLVFADDEFDYRDGTGAFLHHRTASLRKDRSGQWVGVERGPDDKPQGVYAYAESVYGGTDLVVMSYAEALKARENSPSWRQYMAQLRKGWSPSPVPWVAQESQMCQVVAMRRLRHLLVLSTADEADARLARALLADGSVGAQLPDPQTGLWTPDWIEGEDLGEVYIEGDPGTVRPDPAGMTDDAIREELVALCADIVADSDAERHVDSVLATFGLDPAVWPDGLDSLERAGLVSLLRAARDVVLTA